MSVACLSGLMPMASANAQDLSSYAVLAGSTITNAGTTNIYGNVGLSPGSEVADNGILLVSEGVINAANAAAVQAKSDLTTTFNVLMGLSPTGPSISSELGNQTVSAGVYALGAAGLTGTLTLQGDEDDIFVFQIASTLITASASEIVLDGVLAQNVFFVVGSSATLGSTTTFFGQILAQESISLNSEATIDCGAALTQTGAVTMISNLIRRCIYTTDPEDIAEILGDDITGNGGSIIDAIADYEGTLPLSFQILALLSPTDLADALEQLSGELGTEVAPSGTQGMNSFLDLLGGPHGDSRALLTSYDQPTAGGTVSVMGYAAPAAPAGGDAFDGFDAALQPRRDGEWTAWMSGYGSRLEVDGDTGTGSHATTSDAYGVAFGFERTVGADTMVGVAVSGGGTAFDLEDDLGSGQSAVLQAALYARSSFEQAYVAGAVAAGHHRVSLDRTLTFAGTDHYTAEFDATNFAAEIEAGYDMGWFTPYVALRGQAFSTPAYSEVTESGASTFALDYDAGLALSLRTEIGARADWVTDLDDSGTLNLYASAAWAHDMRWGYDSVAEFQLMPGSSFTVSGASPSADSLLATAGAELTTGSGLTLGSSVQGEFTDNALSYGGNASLSYHW